MGNNLTLRHYGLAVGDWQMVSGWHEARHGVPLPETILPPLGIISEDEHGPVAVWFAYQSLGVGVAFLEACVTRPGLTLQQAWAVIGRCLDGIEAVLKKEGYGMIRTFVEFPSLERCLRRFGFAGKNGNLAKLI